MAYTFTYNQAASAIVSAYSTIIKNLNSDTSGLPANGTDSPEVYSTYSITGWEPSRIYYFTVSRTLANYSEADLFNDFVIYLTASGFFTTFPGTNFATVEGCMELVSLMSKFLLGRTRYWYDYFAVSGLVTALFYEGTKSVNTGSLANNNNWISDSSINMITSPFALGVNPTILNIPAVRVKRIPTFNSCSCSSSGFLMYMQLV